MMHKNAPIVLPRGLAAHCSCVIAPFGTFIAAVFGLPKEP
jgi:hypothetical protein